MRVLMQSRKNLFTLPGGDTIQLTKTKEQLERMGVKVDIGLEFDPDLSAYDLVHLSNLTRIQETYLQLLNAKNQNKPVVLSTIFWPMDEFEKKGQTGIRRLLGETLSIDQEEKIKAIARYVKDKDSRNPATKNLITIGYRKMQDFVVNNVDYFLPNSEMEMNELVKYFNIAKENYKVIPNAIDKSIVEDELGKRIPEEFEGFKDAIVCVGRIETRKNQLALLRAMEGTKYKIVLVGKPSVNQKNYFHEIKKYIEKNENVTYIEKIDNSKIYSLYKACKVSALPSWLDTPGLVSLEAGAMGCNLAVSVRGSTTEYFGDYAEYCEPDNLQSIKKAVENAYNKENDGVLRNIILEQYTWEKAAKKTLESYEAVLSKE